MPPPTPIRAIDPIVAGTAPARVSRPAPVAITAAADQSSTVRPTARSSRGDRMPATALPAANAATCSPPTE